MGNGLKDLVKESIEYVINDCFDQHGKSRGDYKLRYFVNSKGNVWADHNIETGYEKVNSSIRKRLFDRGVELNLYYSLSPQAMEYCLNLRKGLTRMKITQDDNFGFPEPMGTCYCFVHREVTTHLTDMKQLDTSE